MDRHHTATTIMTQNHHHHYQQNLTIISNNVQRGRQVTSKDIAHAIDYFEHFLNATSLKNILGYYRSICELLNLKPNHFQLFYPKLKNYLTSWRAKALWKKFDARSIHKCYGKGKISTNTRILIIGAGPCGLRTAIEAQLLGAKVVLIEKRDRLSRNNVLHLWPFVIEDLRGLGAKKFFGKFCAGSIDHISIRQLQCVLLKVALLLGVEVHTEISFERLIEPNPIEKTGWKAEFKPNNHPVAQYEFDVVIGADGKRNTLQGFKRKEFRGKLAIAITANFINKRTEAEARVEEISGVAFIFNQKFFKDLYEDTGIDLENIVYYKDDTHYFVMTAKKPSLIDKGVIKQDLADTERLLAPDNVNREALMDYAREAANFSTNYQMPDLEFAVNHYGQPDVAMFDFTSMYAAENASKIIERHGYRLLMILVGDSLLEPFWPTGSGCARGFLSSLDAAWAIRSWSLGTMTPLEVIAERESIYRLLAQTTPDNLNKDWKAYTLDPTTRYPNLNKNVVIAHQVTSLYDTDNPKAIEKMKRNSQDLMPVDVPKKRRRGNVDSEILVNWVLEQIREHEDLVLTDLASIFRNGKVLCAVINHYRPDLLDYNAIKDDDPVRNNQLAIDILEKEIGIPPIMTGEEITNTDDYLTMATYLTQVYDRFRGEIPHIKHPRLELPENQRNEPSFRPLKPTTVVQQTEIPPTTRISNRHKRHDPLIQINNKGNSVERKTRKRRTLEKVSVSVEERQKTLEEIIANRTERQNKRKQQRRLKTEQFLKSMQMLQANAKPDASPFEDYSIFLYRQTAPNFGDRVKDLERKFTYVPDHENKLPNQTRGSSNTDEDLAARIKSLEDKWKEPVPTEKKPKDLLRAIGKIETSDWNIKEIEKKIRENKLGKPSTNKDKEKVPKWSKEQFLARQTKMEQQHLDRQDSTEAKFADIDRNIKHLELKLKEGTSRDLGQNKVATITEKLVSKIPENEAKPVQKIQSRPAVVLPQGSEFCHFCGKRVYLMERLSAEGRFFHHGCFKCQYCHTQLRLGSYAFDRDGLYDYKFFCIHHYGMPGELKPKITRKPSQKQQRTAGISGVDLLDRVRTPERIEFANLNNQLSDQDESLSQMDEDEWTDRNFGASTAELNTSDDESSSLSDTESDDEDAYEEALEEPATKEGTLKWAERFNKRYSRKRNDSESDDYSSSDHSSYYENTSDDEDSETATEGEEEIRARELRKQEVRVEPPVVQTDTGTDTEVVSDESSESSSEIRNSATEISTDSEFAHDDPTPTRELPPIVFNDFYVTKTRGSGNNHPPKRIQITSAYIQKRTNQNKPPLNITTEIATNRDNIELNLTPLVPSTPSILRKPATLRPTTEGYALNRTQSTGGIAAKVSLELKKKYLLGNETNPGAIQKSGSASTLDTKLKSFHSNISDCQKLLRPASEISASMQTFCKLNETLSPITPPINQISDSKAGKSTEKEQYIFENEPEGRPRSPLHETSIIVPEIDWNKNKNQSSDSLSNSSDNIETKFKFQQIPKVQVDEIPPDSLTVIDQQIPTNIEPLKSICSDKKTLNQPKQLPDIEIKAILPEIHNSLHIKKIDVDIKSDNSTPQSDVEQQTALTETELSDWARDGLVSNDDDYLDDAEFNQKTNKFLENDYQHICGKDNNNKIIITETMNNILSKNLDNIEFMDTGTESSSTTDDDDDDDDGDKNQNGYILFKDDDDDINDDSLNIIDTKNDDLISKNTGYCVIGDEKINRFGEFTDLKPEDIEKFKNNHNDINDDDSLLIIENPPITVSGGGTTTEENTCSDSTVKNLTEIEPADNNFEKQQLEQKLAQLKAEKQQPEIISSHLTTTNETNVIFDQHCQRLQSKIDFGNAKDSIDVRKSRRKSKSESTTTPQKPDLIQEEKSSPISAPFKQIEVLKIDSTPPTTVRTPDVLYKKEFIEKERDVNQKLIQEMVMLRMKSENKSLERKKRRTNRPFELTKSATTDIVTEINRNNSKNTTIFTPPDLLSTIEKSPIQQNEIYSPPLTINDENKNKIDSGDFETPIAPPRYKHEEAKRTAEKLRQDARLRAKFKSNEELGLSPEEKLQKLKEKLLKKDDIGAIVKPERPNSWLYSNDTLNRSLRRTKSGDDRTNSGDNIDNYRTKSIPEILNDDRIEKFYKSDPNLLLDGDVGGKKPKKKDRERRRSLTKIFTTLFKKSPSKSSGIFSKISPKSKDLSKDVLPEEPSLVRRNSFTELSSTSRRCIDNSSPPPVPPLPLNYTGTSIKGTDDSSDGDHDLKRSSCDTLDQSGVLDTSSLSLTKRSKSARRAARQSQLKRHRMAQEIQRKLEETEVKTRELEERGVAVEKALRGEDTGRLSRTEPELLQEWFDLMRDRTELRRYEKELMVRAQELELEDRHARLQHELRERLENNDRKTDEDVAVEGQIINEMMGIVAKRDSLITLLEEDRLRYSTEDRDFDEQMLAKGLRLTPIRKTPEK